MYSLAIHLYALIVALVSPFNKKARMMRLGQWKTNSILRDKIDRKAKYIWFHAASLGEFEQGRPMIEKIRAEHPQYKILLTFFSPSGYEVRKNYKGVDVICYLPFDTPIRVLKFVHYVQPVMAIFIKYEFWMNYLTELKRRGIPVYIISAIFRPQQLFFRWYGKPYRRIFSCYRHIFVQDQASRDLLAHYKITNVSIAGDTRFDRVIDIRKQAHDIPIVEKFVAVGTDRMHLTLISGSTWPPDEEMLIRYFNEHPQLRLIIAPHEIHREHLMYIESLLKRPSVRLSDLLHDDTLVEDKDCLIVDSFGLLSSIYRYGSLAYVGGGFGAGIHNTLEAAVYGIPVVFGPKFQKFKEARDLITVGGGFTVDDERSFREKLDELLGDEKMLTQCGEKAGLFVNGNAGSTDKILKEIEL